MQTLGSQGCFLVGRENDVGYSNMDRETNTSSLEKLSLMTERGVRLRIRDIGVTCKGMVRTMTITQSWTE